MDEHEQSAARCRIWPSNLLKLLIATAAAAAIVATAQAQAPRPAAPPSAPPAVGAAPAEVGVWVDHTKRGAVEIRSCGNSLCGYIYWVKDPLGKDGRPLVDDLNPDAKKKRQPICGLQVIGDLQAQANGSWDKGWIYDPDKGEQFDLEVTLKKPANLQILGYMGTKWLSEKHQWTRAPADLARCAVLPAAAPPAGKAAAPVR